MSRRRPPTTINPTDITELLRRPDKPLPYRWWLRWVDVAAGRRDGRRGLAGALDQGYRLTSDQTTWLRHNTHRHNERVHSETVRHDAAALSLREELIALRGKVKDEKKTLRAARAALQALPAGPADPAARAATEGHTPLSVVIARRTREHDAHVLAPARSQVAAAEAALRSLRTRRREVHASLAALEELYLQRTGRLAEYHARRAHTYERAYLHHVAAAADPRA